MSKNKAQLTPVLRFPDYRNANGWEKRQISQLLTIGNGRDYKHLAAGCIPVYGSGGYMLSVNDFLYDGESVCIGRKGTINKPLFLSGKFWVVDTLFYMHSYSNCTPKFIYNVFQKINWLKYNEAGGVPSLTKTTIGKIVVLVPKDLAEQQKIADCLSSLDDLIAAEDKKLEALKSYKKGLLQKLFPAKGDIAPKLRFPEHKNSTAWEDRTLEAVCNMSAGYYVSSTEINEVQAADPFPCYGGNGLRGYTKTFTHSGKYPLIGRQGALCGNVTLVEGKFHATEHAVVCTPLEGIVVNWLYYQLVMMNLNQYATGQAQPGLSVKVLERLLVKVPTTAEQQKIANCLSSLDNNITSQTAKIEALKSHKKGLMQSLFPTTPEEAE